ncbi:MAG: glycosyltransferase [Candidatus Aminicenantes bacterium]|nr:glycosyltransferase [Candidatus Aminicenantes bacterium]NIM82085.1 glycosyltransferase [Candidatus Aminicenantes bacterium]NIN21479.1 glycosyltransferase [Candidatus Aminicenantes bacterium]NIN45291.1 glycosyltransferase [Candidatus Aminicenantes bacterium]NIN88108.1 glycosyltransferase [Candidatus Aminicenantes bacterium]
MKILLIHNFYRYRGGEDRYVRILEEVLRQNGHQVIHFFSDSRSIKQFNFLQKCLIPLKLINSSAASKELEKMIQQEKPHLAVAHNLMPLLSLSLLNVLKRNNIPILKRLENYKFLCLNGLFLRNNFNVCEVCRRGNFIPGIIHRCYQKSFFSSLGIAISEFIHRKLKTVSKTADLFLATSDFVKSKFVEAGFPGEKISVFPNFLDFEPEESVGQPENYAIYVGRLSKEKGLVTLLKAFKELPELPLKILGEGPLVDELKEFTRLHRMTHVTFEGFIDGQAKREILKKALLLVFPSECYESFGYSIIESYACGVPVVASDIGGARELVQNGENGFLFEVGNPEDLQKKISALLSDRQQLMRMKERALERAKKSYTKEIGYQDLAALFKRLV